MLPSSSSFSSHHCILAAALLFLGAATHAQHSSPGLAPASPSPVTLEPLKLETLTDEQASLFFAQHRFCHVEMRRTEAKAPPRTARELRRAQEAQASAPGSQQSEQGQEQQEVDEPAPPSGHVSSDYASRELLAVSGSGERLALSLAGKLTPFDVTRRKRDRLDIVLTLHSLDGELVATLRQNKPLLGCTGTKVKTCRMSEATLLVEPSPKAGQDSTPEMGLTQALLVRDLCGSARKETLFRAPIDLSGLSEWKVQ